MTRALALTSLLLLAAAPRTAQPKQPPPPLEVSRVEDNGATFVRLAANEAVEDIAVRVEPTGRLVEFRAMKPGEVRKVAVVGATGVVVAARGLPAIRLELSAQPAQRSERPQPDARASKEKLDRSSITKEIQKHTKEVRACYEKALPKNPKLAGKLTMEWAILPSGAIGAAKIKDSTLEDRTVGPCILANLKTWKFPPGSEETVIAFPFVFKPQ